MKKDYDFNPFDEPKRPSPWPGPIALLGLALLVLIIYWSCSCQSTFYENGKVTARIMGDYSYKKSAKGDIEIKVNHSVPIRAGGIATTQIVGATGTAASAVILAKP